MRVIRQLIWEEPVFFGDDFKNGIRSNALPYFAVSLIAAFFHSLIGTLGSSWMTSLMRGLLASLLVPVGIWILLQAVFYRLSLRESVKDALISYVKTFPATLLLMLITALPFWLILHFITLLSVKYLLLAGLMVFFVPAVGMVWLLYACHFFDRYVNKENYPSIYGKGMYPGRETPSANERP